MARRVVGGIRFKSAKPVPKIVMRSAVLAPSRLGNRWDQAGSCSFLVRLIAGGKSPNRIFTDT